jgi:hypothetical protein
VFTEIPEQQGTSQNTSLDIEIPVFGLNCSPHLPCFHLPLSSTPLLCFPLYICCGFLHTESFLMLFMKFFKNKVKHEGVKWRESKSEEK